ncbi:MAG: ATP-binding cassette domain-containing protein [Flavipsychrobacter sp.]|nr:ATP-binding cassette domain-containing protein [Flavipsychrobacter sp.]
MAHSVYVSGSDQLIAEQVFVSIGQREILKGVTISATRGSITGLLGRNGSGKSTMLQAVFGTRRAIECSVFVNGIKINTPYTRHGLINYLPQQRFLPPSLTVQTVMKQFGADLNVALHWFPELADVSRLRISELSGGTERLVSVVLLLLGRSRFVLLDEPFSHIMPLHVARLQQLMQEQKLHKGIIITDHMYAPLLDICDNIYLMKEGHTVFIRNREDLILHGYLSSL